MALIWCDELRAIREVRETATPAESLGIIAPIQGDADRETRLHYEVRLSLSPNFTDEIIFRSDDPDTADAWRLLRAHGDPTPFPAPGVEAWHEWSSRDNDFAVMERCPRGEVGSSVLFMPAKIGLNGHYFYRIRAWDVNIVEDGEAPVSEPGKWTYGIS